MRHISCRANERLLIGNDIVVTVLEVGQDRVRLGVENSQAVPAYREIVVRLDGGEEDSFFNLLGEEVSSTDCDSGLLVNA